MTTYADLQTAVARDVRDPNLDTFSTDDIKDFIRFAITEIGRICPERFQEDITPIADTLDYVVRGDSFAGQAQPEIDLVRVELWDASVTPNRFITSLRSSADGSLYQSNAGWTLWQGVLSLTNGMEQFLSPDTHIIRVWGYSPWVQPTSDDDPIGMSNDLEVAVRQYAKLTSLERLNADRELFSQWQVRSNNSDISPAGLMNALSLAQDQWRRTSRAIAYSRATSTSA